MEKNLVDRSGIPFKAIPAAGVHGVGVRSMPRNLAQLGRGYLTSRRILHDFRPDALLFTGGYVAVPTALAGIGIPSLLFVPDIEPGLALKTLARFAGRIALSTEESKRWFRNQKKVVVTGYPTRSDLSKWDRKSARRTLHLDDTKPTLLVLGGSKGAHSINLAVKVNLAALLEMAQVVHITGEQDWPEIDAMKKSLSPSQSKRYHPFSYLHEEMGAALAAADLVVSRAGASTLGDYPLFCLPAILVPYPHAWRYQLVNADYLAGKGAAEIIRDADLPDQLVRVVHDLLGNPGRMKSMRGAMSSLARPHAAEEIGRHLMDLHQERR